MTSKEFQPGILRMQGRNVQNTTASLEEVAEITRRLNTSEFLRQTFFENNPDILTTQTVESGGRVTVMRPSGPYTEEALMVIAAGPHSFDQEYASTETIYDYPLDVQMAYWQRIVTALEVFACKEGENCTVVATENCIKVRSNEQVRTSRSISLPHAQILRIHHSHIEPEDWSFDHLSKEQRVLKSPRLIHAYLELLQTVCQQQGHTELNQLSHQKSGPFGYTFDAGNPLNIAEVTQSLAVHHEAYTVAAQETLALLKNTNAARIIPQPSYRLFMTIEEEKVIATISPEFISHAGVVEAIGIKLDRGPEYARRIEDDRISALHTQVIQELTTTRTQQNEALRSSFQR